MVVHDRPECVYPGKQLLVQSIHIVGIAVVFGSIFLIAMRILGITGTDQTLPQTTNRYGPWLTGSLWLLLATGGLMVVGEPVRELVTFSFWFKMFLIVVGTMLAVMFRKRANNAAGVSKALAVVTVLIWASIIVLGRLIAYDQVWGSWSPAAA